MNVLNNEHEILSKNAYQTALLNRAMQSILNSFDVDSLSNTIEMIMESLSLSGCAKLDFAGHKKVFCFGECASRNYFHDLKEISLKGQKVLSRENFIIFNTENILLIITIAGLKKTDCDLLQDNLAIFSDTLQSWIDIRSTEFEFTKSFSEEKERISYRLSETSLHLDKLSCHLEETFNNTSEYLLSNLIMQFPLMALESDQEEKILDIVNSAIKQQRQALLDQLNINCDISSIMSDAIRILDQKQNRNSHDNCQTIKGIELF